MSKNFASVGRLVAVETFCSLVSLSFPTVTGVSDNVRCVIGFSVEISTITLVLFPVCLARGRLRALFIASSQGAARRASSLTT